jgi:hypothetical protein
MPEYNILKTAGSRLGQKLSEKTKKAISISSRKYKCTEETKQKIKDTIKYNKELYTISKVVTTKTKFKLSLNSHGIIVKIYDDLNNFIKKFNSIKEVAKYLNVSVSTIYKIFKTGVSHDNLIYKFETKDLRVFVYDSDYKLQKIFNNSKETSI